MRGSPLQVGQQVPVASLTANGHATTPPPRYTEATLLSAMEGAGKLIDDDELREAMAEKGLGTPATRAQTIEGLIAEKYMLRDGRELVPTAKAFQLMTLLRGLAIEDLTRADLTEKILDIKREKGWSWKHICEKIGGYSEVLIVGAILGQMKLTEPKQQ